MAFFKDCAFSVKSGYLLGIWVKALARPLVGCLLSAFGTSCGNSKSCVGLLFFCGMLV